MKPVALSLGANLDRPEEHLRVACEELGRHLSAPRVSAPYITEPISGVPQSDFLNVALVGRCALSPEQLMAIAKSLELAAGRRRTVRFGPRPLDIDLLVFGGRVQARAELTLPHPRLAERRFYLEPLASIAPTLRVPPQNRTIAELLEAVVDSGRVQESRWKGSAPLLGQPS